MKLIKLDGEQRLRIIFVFGQQQGNVSQIRLWGRVVDKIDLNDEEKSLMSIKNDGKTIQWDQSKIISLKEFNLEEEEYNILKETLSSFPGFSSSDRRWLEPVMIELDKK